MRGNTVVRFCGVPCGTDRDALRTCRSGVRLTPGALRLHWKVNDFYTRPCNRVRALNLVARSAPYDSTTQSVPGLATGVSTRDDPGRPALRIFLTLGLSASYTSAGSGKDGTEATRV